MQRTTPRAPLRFDGGFLAAETICYAAKIPATEEETQAPHTRAKICAADVFWHPKTPFLNL
jgi:hypothetical protein